MGVRRLRHAAALVLAFAVAASARAATLAPDSAGVRWTFAARPAWTSADSLARLAEWRERLASPATAPTALRVLADWRAAAGDSAGADSCRRALAALASPWQWEALRAVADAVAAARGPAAADSVLEPAARTGWPDAERAQWLDRRAAFALAAGDTARAAAFSRQVLQVYGSIAAPAARALARLDSLAGARGDSLGADDLRAAADAAAFRADRAGAIRLERRALARTDAGARGPLFRRLAELHRDARQPLAALAAADSAARLADGPDAVARAGLERARALRDAGRTDSAFAAYARVQRMAAAGLDLRATAAWEAGREAEDRGRWREALAAFARAAQLGDSRAAAARVRAGLVQVVLGHPDSAAAWWRGEPAEDARFWLGVTLRATDRTAGDSLLRGLARLPGYGVYRAAARETLGMRGWPDSLAWPAPAESSVVADDVRRLLASHRTADARALAVRWRAGDERLGAARRDAWTGIALAAAAYDAGDPAEGTRLADRASLLTRDERAAWPVIAWAYPPAYEPQVAAAESLGVERALLWALMRQESRFDPRARSKSNALGLTQMLPKAAIDAAQLLHRPVPADSELFDPPVAIAFGARYLARLLQRFAGSVPVALAAYNAGPGTIRADWRTLVDRGGDALYVEFASNAASQDYARRILGFRQAYRELRPHAAGGSAVE